MTNICGRMLLEEDSEQVKFLRDPKAQEPTPRTTILQPMHAIITTDNRELKLNMQLLAILRLSIRMEWSRVENGMVSSRTALWDCYRLYRYIGYRLACYSRWSYETFIPRLFYLLSVVFKLKVSVVNTRNLRRKDSPNTRLKSTGNLNVISQSSGDQGSGWMGELPSMT